MCDIDKTGIKKDGTQIINLNNCFGRHLTEIFDFSNEFNLHTYVIVKVTIVNIARLDCVVRGKIK